ncbi:hypothetical protein FZEAL_6262 [Fusarium zealandicum]|uniref:Uncharacterized protein n=1 Tax=Fusarium zealandicum TaxID=1053134 RepID=A0A8H4UID5_9HYPO|nr:hypothetical protein FZEAL_6262 [Fusarium zealandicum]
MATADDTNNNNNNSFAFTDTPFAWVLIPVVSILFLGLIATVIQVRRRRRRRNQQWPGYGPRVPGTSGPPFGTRNTRQGAPWSGTRSQEGLNELGEAPPPYAGKKEGRESTEMHDLEAGGSPPEYPAVPGPALTTGSRRDA